MAGEWYETARCSTRRGDGIVGAVLDALARLSTDGNDVELDASGALRTKRWLVANGLPIAPEDVLALPTAVDEAARTILGKHGEAPPFEPVGRLAIEFRRHSSFEFLCEGILPDQHCSFEVLAWLIEEARIVGRPGSVDPELVGDLALLALEGRDPGLPGWELIRVGLAALKDDPDQSFAFVTAFPTLSPACVRTSATAPSCLRLAAPEVPQNFSS